ncbi:hypothetical protein JZ751_005067 [Albula glossodonta]|uniref:Uncharacterized protein n=1 Tax=Albula glossodonta TaxID=121402 RepID=A0A8T2P6K5_9TELE|nr:hypothetical protein JZ751_005067 [Albula glossodonta]
MFTAGEKGEVTSTADDDSGVGGLCACLFLPNDTPTTPAARQSGLQESPVHPEQHGHPPTPSTAPTFFYSLHTLH